MKRITKEEFDSIISDRGSNNPINPLVTEIFTLNVNEGAEVANEEWTAKQPLSSYIYTKGKKVGKKFSVRKLADGAGWAVLRKS